MDTSVFNEGIKLMVVGMGMVFTFLVLMVIIISLAAKVLAPFAGCLEEPVKAKKKPAKKAVAGAADDSSIVAAIISAVHQFRQDQDK